MLLKIRLFDLIRLCIKVSIPESVICKFTVGKTYGNLLTKLVPNHYQFKQDSFRTTNRHGINYYLDISDIIGWYIYFGFEEKAKENLLDLAKRNDVVLDIGANIGETTLRLAKRIQPEGKLYSFEPSLYNFTQLNKNISLNKVDNIRTLNQGVGNQEGKYRLYIIDDFNKGKNKISEEKITSSRSEEIKIITIDQFIDKNNIQKLDLIKIDTEGFEMKVLEGGEKTLTKLQPNLFIEVDNKHLSEQGSSAYDLLNYLKRLNFQLYDANTKQRLNLSNNFDQCHFDLIAIPTSKKA